MFGPQDCPPAEKPHVSWLPGLVAAGLLVLALNGCNTMSGMGEDVEAAGGAMSDTAEETEEEIEEE